MNVSVVIPALNEADQIEQSAASAWEAGAWEVIVADGGSTDDTVPRARRLKCRVVEGRRGRAAQQNRGAAAATGEILLFLHADGRLGRNSVRQIQHAMQDKRVISGAFRQKIDSPGILYRLLEWGNACRVRWWGLAYGDQAIFVRRKVFAQLGGFPTVDLMEDVMLMDRLGKLAHPRLLPGPVIVSARRWQRHGVLRQTWTNWRLLTLYRLGMPPARLAASYPRHDTEQAE